MAPAAPENKAVNQDAQSSLRIHLKRVRELFDQYESVEIGSGSARKVRPERLMTDMDHE
jgi:hypothetical protein